jgi:selenide,water dikinase
MLRSNAAAARIFRDHGATSCTDVTGFGLLGHLRSMVKGSGVTAEINLSAVPLLPGTRDLLERGVAPGGTHRNVSSVNDVVRWDPDLTDDDHMLLCDAQTSGGLLISVPADKAAALVAALQEEGTPCAAVVGRITDGDAGTIVATP